MRMSHYFFSTSVLKTKFLEDGQLRAMKRRLNLDNLRGIIIAQHLRIVFLVSVLLSGLTDSAKLSMRTEIID